MITLPARAQRAFTCRALAALACIGALALSSCSAQPQANDSETAPMKVATSSAPVDAKTLFTAADGSWKPNTVQIAAGLDSPATYDSVATPTNEPSTNAEYEAAYATASGSVSTIDPGTRCGVTSLLGGSAGIYVYDGSDCAKAQEAVRLFNSRKNQDGAASVEWYQCATKVQGRDYITGACFTQGGSVEKPRLALIPAQTRMLSGTLTFAEAYGGGTFGQGDSAKTVEALRFTSPDSKVACSVTPSGVDCQAMVGVTLEGWDAASGKAQQRVHMVQGQAPEVSLVGQTATPEPVNTEGIVALSTGQVVTAYGYTCKSVNTGKVHCVSATNGFTLDSMEVGLERR
ncbi:2-oxoglutarate dehydrogenase [Rothia mucilaginosa]|uniref:2-oxoglutarate dehydrogenase n=1 Tax=Rothia mucilaginosa TaxID=43675 RepID=UPI001CB3A5BF|nr:2-oxoglutarate dehydrogenase [Rothia mucilaginosa]MBF1642077.1 2-oxoglutarate dehydrogenase [Rothia mucilaginosa]UQF82854.1 MAG: 2-oxoglutarate dehydrogenase [Rothia mucilaginosa]